MYQKIVIKVMPMKRKLVLFLVFQMWTQSWFLWIVIAEVAATVGDKHTGDDSKPKSYDNTGNNTTVEKINNTIQSPIHIKHSEEKVLHPSQPVVAAREIPQMTRTPRLKVGSSQLSQMILIKPPVSPPRTPTPPRLFPPMQALVLVWLPTLPHGFSGVTACLHTPELIEVDLKVPVGTMPIRLVATPGISSVSSSHIVKDEITGITYMDTITTSIGRVTLSGPEPEACSTGPTIEDITDQV